MPFNPVNYQFSLDVHRDKNVIAVYFPFSQQWVNELRQKFPSAKWSASKKYWYLPNSDAIRIEIGMSPKTISGRAIVNQIHSVNYEAIKLMHETLLLKAYSPNTIRIYIAELSQLLRILKDVHVDSLTPERLRAYFLYCISTLKLSENAMHSRINAVKFYFEQVLHREKFFFEVPRPKKNCLCQKSCQRKMLQKYLLIYTTSNTRLCSNCATEWGCALAKS